ncbi:MAG: hypothetical protein QOJ89_1423, partial [bacterium]
MADPLPHILAGPILRRTDATGAWVWLATSEKVDVTASTYDAKSSVDAKPAASGLDGITPLASGTATSTAYGAALHVTVVGMLPASGAALPSGQLLAYDLEIVTASGTKLRLDSRANPDLAGDDRIAYPPYSLPTFFVAPATSVNLLHGSCRKVHGDDDDAFAGVDAVLSASVADLVKRPSALFLTGDQIYADDVHEAMAKPLDDLGRRVVGFDELVPAYPGKPAVAISTLTDGNRGHLLADVFTADHPDNIKKSSARNQLVGFADFVAMHLLHWNRAVWPATIPGADQNIRAFRSSLTAVRRGMANIPTYMMLDDHEVTDDWNRTKGWQAKAEASPLGRRIIANGIVAFWALQGCGNDPAAPPPDAVALGAATAAFFAGRGQGDPTVYEKAALAFRDFSFVAPTHPKAVVVDMRTTRGPDAGDLVDGRAPDPGAPCEILGKRGVDAFIERAKAVCEPGGLLVVVAPAPVVGYAQWERPQEFVAELDIKPLNADVVDLESWHGNPAAYHRFLLAITEEVKPGATLFLSGDVHFAHVAKAVLTPQRQPGQSQAQFGFTQMTSSSLKHRHTGGKRFALNLAGTLVPDLDPEWVWRPKDPHDSLPKVRVAAKSETAKAIAELGAPPDYHHRSYSVGERMCADTPLLVTVTNLGQLEMADAGPAT